MNILVTGANGFIGGYLTSALAAAGHSVTAAVRRPSETLRRLPVAKAIAVDFNRATTPATWFPHLRGIDAIVNCVGILQARPGQSMRAVHVEAPRALFTAAEQVGVRRVIHISAISATAEAGTEYAATKHAGDAFLAESSLDWAILKPSLVYAEGAYGGTALLRAVASLPGFIPLVGRGDQPFAPIHVHDVAELVVRLVSREGPLRLHLEPVGPDTLTLREILGDLRCWLGWPDAPFVSVPLPLVRLAARAGDHLGATLNTTALRQLLHGNAGDAGRRLAETSAQPRRWRDALRARPAQVQDRWHARLYFLRAPLRWTLALTWIVSGFIGLGQADESVTVLFGDIGAAAGMTITAASLADLAIGVGLLARFRPPTMTVVQLIMVIAYTLGLSVLAPGLWLEPFGPLLKNLPLLAAIPILAALEVDR